QMSQAQGVEELVEADVAFHAVIARATGNPVLTSLLASLATRTLRVRLWHGRTADDALEVTREEHRRIYEAIMQGDAELAREAAALQVVDGAWQEGLRFFDTAPLYGFGLAERHLGRILREKARADYTFATKVGRLLHADAPPEPGQVFHGAPALNPVFDFSYDGVMRSLEESLERLAIGRVDILHIHDPDDHYDEALSGAYRALDELRQQGVIGAVGAGMNQA